MYSDDSAASEVESEVEEAYGDGGSEVASEIAESVDVRESPAKLKQQPKQQTPIKASVSDAYEEDEDGYSVDFEDDFEEDDEEAPAARPPPSAPITKAPSPTRSVISNARRSAVQSDDASAYEYEYDEASFEEESRRSQSQRSLSQSNRVVDLSVRSASPSFRPAPTQESNSELPGANFVAPSEVRTVVSDTRILSRPTAAALASVAEEEAEAVATIQSKQFSLLLRKVESKFEDEVEELREKNALLTWKERELKASLRRAKEELTMRKVRIEKSVGELPIDGESTNEQRSVCSRSLQQHIPPFRIGSAG